ncbi:catechol 2,3-dioxygenase-like lactoylglutathione lyase family enzyme [Sphingomonas zeicaulis]|uniref:VOC family protein n=1 Tax=Sphingomonas zeicaulis TaxID=1632740 RepID=UPI003D1AA338
MSQAKYGPIAQIGMVTGDLDASIARWIATMGVGPWTLFRNVMLKGRFRGQEAVVRMDVGLAYQGETQVELIHVTNGAVCPYLAADGTPLAGLHHLAWITDDLDATLADAEADGLRTLFRAESPGTRVAYLEAPGEAGILFEFIESAQTRQLIADGIAATRVWDGSDPIRVIDFAAEA